MHRLSRISASFTSKKNDPIDSSGDRTDKRFSRPSVLLLPHKEGSVDDVNENGKHDEWYELMTATTPPVDVIHGIDKTDQKMKCDANDMLKKTSSTVSGLDQIDLEPDNAAEIEALEQSLTALVDNFRSGRMCALDEEKLKMMREAREEMENLTSFHVKLHKIQAPNFSTFSDNGQLDEQYDLLFRKLDKLHCFLYDMSFRANDIKDVKEEDRMAVALAEEKDGEMMREQL
ncbi:unnamed protein product [Litomosoides sigmodontis]|uniref:Uncharacterized protein n=1 Tax=Litomosoides sigmodontis TaxID=42156 RepID=A0A3P6TG25_LITSI|nr:unnamed protein product [Litomosoides sigmodontis]